MKVEILKTVGHDSQVVKPGTAAKPVIVDAKDTVAEHWIRNGSARPAATTTPAATTGAPAATTTTGAEGKNEGQGEADGQAETKNPSDSDPKTTSKKSGK